MALEYNYTVSILISDKTSEDDALLPLGLHLG